MKARSEETWLVDLGNSRAKLARLDRGAPADVAALAWDQPDFSGQARAWIRASPRPARILVASVASAARAERVRRVLPAGRSVAVEWLRSPRRACGIGNRYAKPERLGIDRFLSMVAVRSRMRGACIVVGCGTAMTLDGVAADGTHVAGMIVLSPARMLESLRSGTAIPETNPDAFGGGRGDDTAVALQEGCWAAAGALVEWFAERQRARSGAAPVWMHGGWAGPLRGWLARDGCEAAICENAVLRGLAAWAGRR